MLETRLAGGVGKKLELLSWSPLPSSHDHGMEMGRAVSGLHIADVTFSRVFPHSGQKAF